MSNSNSNSTIIDIGDLVLENKNINVVEPLPKIFVQIASFCDPQLPFTLRSIIDEADSPNQLVIGIAHQYNPADAFADLNEFENDSRFKILYIPYQEAKGVCWARHQVQQLYNDEEYTLQIDSHMRFAPHWDTELITMLKVLQGKGVKKPLLTSYVSSFNPENDPAGRIQVPWQMAFDRFTPEGCVFFLPETIPNWEKMTAPVTSRFYSGHFAFTLGIFSKEVQHNPAYYFHGEEISIAARAFTHGYDMYHPHRVLVWHEYTRKGRVKQWDVDKSWATKNSLCHRLNRKLFAMDGEKQEGHDGPYGFGKERTLREYEIYAGIHFATRSVQQYTLDKKYPPNPPVPGDEKDWLASFTRRFKHCINVAFSSLNEKDYDFWVVVFEDKTNESLFRKDADEAEIKELMALKTTGELFTNIWREFDTSKQPARWVVWPHSISKGWCERVTGEL
jgi:hypothetical protein